jgi:hypothetical protein
VTAWQACTCADACKIRRRSALMLTAITYLNLSDNAEPKLSAPQFRIVRGVIRNPMERPFSRQR